LGAFPDVRSPVDRPNRDCEFPFSTTDAIVPDLAFVQNRDGIMAGAVAAVIQDVNATIISEACPYRIAAIPGPTGRAAE
jgi:hypothetical protein